MSKSIEKFTKRGVRTSYVSTTVGMSLVLFVIGIIFAGAIGINTAQIQAKESLQGDVFFNAEMNDKYRQKKVYKEIFFLMLK